MHFSGVVGSVDFADSFWLWAGIDVCGVFACVEFCVVYGF